MKRKFFAIVTSLLLLLTVPKNASADDYRVIDNASLLTAVQWSSLEEKAESLSETYQMDIAILTVSSLNGKSPQAYADDYFLRHYGDSDDGILLLLSMEERDWYITVSGDAIDALTDYGIQDSMAVPLTYLAEDDYWGGLNVWLDGLPFYLDACHAGTPIDGQVNGSVIYDPSTHEAVVQASVSYEEDASVSLPLSVLIGLAVAAVAIVIMRSSMNTKRPQHSASDYLVKDSFRLRVHQDLYLYSNITKTPRPKQTSSNGSSGHRSSGGGGKF